MLIQSSHSRSWETAILSPGHKQTSSQPTSILVSCLHKTLDPQGIPPRACSILPSKEDLLSPPGQELEDEQGRHASASVR